jgi:hypothetical protein
VGPVVGATVGAIVGDAVGDTVATAHTASSTAGLKVAVLGGVVASPTTKPLNGMRFAAASVSVCLVMAVVEVPITPRAVPAAARITVSVSVEIAVIFMTSLPTLTKSFTTKVEPLPAATVIATTEAVAA